MALHWMDKGGDEYWLGALQMIQRSHWWDTRTSFLFLSVLIVSSLLFSFKVLVCVLLNENVRLGAHIPDVQLVSTGCVALVAVCLER